MTIDASRDRMPAGIPFIIANEFAERFCYYGINAILSIYMVQFLHFGEAQATQWQSLFKSGAYFFPLLGAIVSDVFWGKVRTIMAFSLAYSAGCALLAFSTGPALLAPGLFLIGFGTGGIKPCVSTNVGDQFTSRNAHLIERGFSYFYLAINAGSLISIYLCPILLPAYGPRLAFGIPGLMMLFATLVFWLGRKRFAVIPPAGKAWLHDVFSASGLKTIASLLMIYVFVAVFWSLWEQSNGQTWTLQATSSLMDKNLGFGLDILPAQIQLANALFVLIFSPLFTLAVYPFWSRFFAVTPLRKIGIGLFVTASSFLIIAWIEWRIQNAIGVSVWWQILAYAVLTAGEVLVYITALEFSYKQAPLRAKSFIMALFLLANSIGNLFTAGVNHFMVRPLEATAIETGEQTWVHLGALDHLVPGQKIDIAGAGGIEIHQPDGSAAPLAGTYLIRDIDTTGLRVSLIDVVERQPLASSGSADAATAQVSTYTLVGPVYFLFFAGLMAAAGVLFVFVALGYRERTFVRADEPVPA